MRPLRTITRVALAASIVPLAAAVELLEVPSEPSQEPGSEASKETNDTAAMIREAKLPAGFPEPSSIGSIHVKRYPAYRAAESDRFMTLFRHIQREDIAMTAPVDMGMRYDEASKRWRSTHMRFIYQQPDMGTAGRDPNNDEVNVVDMPAREWLTISVRGQRSGKAVTRALNKLKATAQAQGHQINPQEVRMLGYNSPFIPSFLQVYEIQVPLTSRALPSGSP